MKKLLIALVVFVAIVAATTRRAEIYREATSPDGSWSVAVLRKKNRLYPVLDGVSVIVRIKNQQKQNYFRARDRQPRWMEGGK